MNGGIEGKIPAGGKKIVLAGNPNVGKSVIFNALTGLYVDVSNYPGTTLDMACGRYGSDVVIDTPGVYGISSLSEEENIARDIILAADIVVNVANAVHLEQDLFFTLQLIDMGVPMILALNMSDEAVREGLDIDGPLLLEELLGVPVVLTAAVRSTGIEELKNKLYSARKGRVEQSMLNKINKIPSPAGRAEALLILEGDVELSEAHGIKPGTERDSIYSVRREKASWIASEVVKETRKGVSFSSRLGYWMLLPITGFPLLFLTLWAVYEMVGVFFAQYVVEITEGFMHEYYEPALRVMLGQYFPPDSVVSTILAGEYGVLTLTVTYLIGLLLPLVLGIFLVLSILEDTGYLPRIATLVDRTLSGLGLNGQAIIPLILGFGCVTMACITTRLLGSDRERRIAIFLLAFGVPCSAQMAIIMAVFAGLGPLYMLLYAVCICSILIVTGTLLGRFLPGGASPLMIELPPLRLPGLKNIFTKAWLRSYQFIKEAFPLFAGGALFLSMLEVTGLLGGLRNLMVPLTVRWLHLPAEIADVFIMGFIRKEFGAASILNLNMLPVQLFVVMLTLTLTVPCIAATMVIFKERGWREGLLTWSVIYTLAFLIGGLTARLLEAFSLFSSMQVPAMLGLIILTMAFILALSRMYTSRRAKPLKL